MMRKKMLAVAVSAASQAMPKRISCPHCESTNVETTWIESIGAMPEWEHAEREDCGHEWNESGRE